MSYPSGAPGNYPGQPPQQPNQPYGQQPAYPTGVRLSLNLGQIVWLVVAVLGLVNLFLGFASFASSCGGLTGADLQACESIADKGPGGSFYANEIGWIPGLLAVAGLLAVLTMLPGRKDVKWGGLVAVVNVGAVLPVLISFWDSNVSLGTGAILIMIFAIVQLLAAVVGYLLEAGIVALPVKPTSSYGQTGPYPPSGTFPPAGGQPQQGRHVQQPSQAPGGYGQQGTQPTPQSTQFLQQPGQLSQQPSTPPEGFGHPQV